MTPDLEPRRGPGVDPAFEAEAEAEVRGQLTRLLDAIPVRPVDEALAELRLMSRPSALPTQPPRRLATTTADETGGGASDRSGEVPGRGRPEAMAEVTAGDLPGGRWSLRVGGDDELLAVQLGLSPGGDDGAPRGG